MSSPIRVAEPNTTHYVKLNPLDEVIHFRDEDDVERYKYYMNTYASIYSINVYAHFLKGNKVDMCFHDEKGMISKFIQDIESNYSKYYNKKYGRKGALYKARFTNEVIKKSNLRNVIREFRSRNNESMSVINDGSLINTTLDSDTVIDELCDYFEISKEVFYYMIKFNTNMASIAAFCLRCFSSLIHRNIVKVLKGFSVTMSSTLSLNGLKLIQGKYGRIYDKLLMRVYLDKSKYCNSIV